MPTGLPMSLSTFIGRGRASAFVLVLATAAAFLSACGGSDSQTLTANNSPAPSGGTNNAPTISGTPLSAVLQGTQYSFSPSANDTDGDVLTFSITNMPGWATFDASTGTLSGTPGSGDIGTYSNIGISVTDGSATADLTPFSIDVQGTATGSATLSWTPPTQNDDGSALTDLAGYKVYWGTSQGNYSNSVTLNNPGLSSYVVDQLTPATWYFVTTAINSQGVESVFSNVASKTVL